MSSPEEQVRARYRHFATVEATTSPAYVRLAHAVAEDDAVVALLAALPRAAWQPNLLFGVLRLRGVDVTVPREALGFVHTRRDVVAGLLRTRRTQTNEIARAGVLLPALALLPEPLALLDAGASAGLGLLLDRWRYRWLDGDGSGHRLDPPGAGPIVTCGVSGPAPLPERVPRIAWRAGLDAHPLDPREHGSREWLRALVWPGHHRRARDLDAALDVAAQDPPRVERGDLVDDLAALLREAPPGATPVVMHSVALVYLEPERREAFRATVASLGAHRIGLEHHAVLPHLADQLPPEVHGTDRMVLSLDDRALALAGGHGDELTWLDRAAGRPRRCPGARVTRGRRPRRPRTRSSVPCCAAGPASG